MSGEHAQLVLRLAHVLDGEVAGLGVGSVEARGVALAGAATQEPAWRPDRSRDADGFGRLVVGRLHRGSVVVAADLLAAEGIVGGRRSRSFPPFLS